MRDILLVLLGALAGGLVAHFLDLGRSRLLKSEADIKEEQLHFLPLIEAAMRSIALAGSQPL